MGLKTLLSVIYWLRGLCVSLIVTLLGYFSVLLHSGILTFGLIINVLSIAKSCRQWPVLLTLNSVTYAAGQKTIRLVKLGDLPRSNWSQKWFDMLSHHLAQMNNM